MGLPAVSEKIKRISIAKGEGIEIDLSERQADLHMQQNRDSEIANMCIDELFHKLKSLNLKYNDFNFVFGAMSPSLKVNMIFARGQKPRLQYLNEMNSHEIKKMP